MKVSIITVVYNAAGTLEHTIKSVISQTVFDKIEYIIIDGGSKDGTLDIIDKYRPFFAKVVSEPDKGIYDAMNKGIEAATGDVIGILNADDIYMDNGVVESVLRRFEESAGLAIFYGDLVYVKKDDPDVVMRKWYSGKHDAHYFENGNVPAHPTVFLRKEVYDEVGLFDTSYKLAADYEFLLRVFRKHSYSIFYHNAFMIKMRLGGATNKSIANIYKGNIEIRRAWRQNKLRIPIQLFPLRIIKRLSQFFK